MFRQLCAKVRSDTMFFLLIQGVQAIRHRKSKTAVSLRSTEDAVYGLDHGPPNTKEKWLIRVVYWGTILLVAFFFWEYVKAK
jgi:hypothetical protein